MVFTSGPGGISPGFCCLLFLERPSFLPHFLGRACRVGWLRLMFLSYLRRKKLLGRRDLAHQSDELRTISSFKRRCLRRNIIRTNILTLFSFSLERNDKPVSLVIGSSSAVIPAVGWQRLLECNLWFRCNETLAVLIGLHSSFQASGPIPLP